jgi:hypothetical protein
MVWNAKNGSILQVTHKYKLNGMNNLGDHLANEVGNVYPIFNLLICLKKCLDSDIILHEHFMTDGRITGNVTST